MLNPAPVQTTYTRYQLPGQNGMLASEINWDADTRIVETDDGIPFGRAVSQGSNDQGCVIGGSDFVGITRADPTLISSSDLTVDVYPKNFNAGILVKGDLWVYCTESVVAGEAVHYDTSDGTLSNSGGTAIDDARWMTSAVAGPNLTVTGHDAPVGTFIAVVRLGNISGNA